MVHAPEQGANEADLAVSSQPVRIAQGGLAAIPNRFVMPTRATGVVSLNSEMNWLMVTGMTAFGDLRQDYEHHRLGLVQAQGSRDLVLSVGDRLQAAYTHGTPDAPNGFDGIAILCHQDQVGLHDGPFRGVTHVRKGLATSISPARVLSGLSRGQPKEYEALFQALIEGTLGGRDVIFSTRMHNNLGLASANTLAAISAGVRKEEVMVNGIGERAANSSLDEFVKGLYTWSQFHDPRTNVQTQEIHRTSYMVSRYTGMVIQPNKAIVGANAFAHEAGIHQDGVLKHKRTYEIMDAETVGLNQHRQGLVLGKHSGRHALRTRLDELGYHMEPAELNEVLSSFKELADKKTTVTETDLEALVADEVYQPKETWELVNVQVQCGSNLPPTAVVILRRLDSGEEVTDAGFGTGPVDAVYQGINRIVGVENTLVEFVVQAATAGMDANGDVTIRIEVPDRGRDMVETAQGRVRRRLFSGRGVDTAIIVASAKAYLQALNKQIASETEDALLDPQV